MDRELTSEEVEGLEDLEHHLGYRVVIQELQAHLDDCINGLKGAKNWEEHIQWMSRIGLLEEMIPLRITLLSEDDRAKKQKLDEREE